MIWNGDVYRNDEDDYLDLPPIWINPYQDNVDRYNSMPRVPECEHPLSVGGRLVPCGHCVLCQARKKKEWINRNVCEAKLHHNNCFLTLTLDDDHLLNAIYPTVQNFLKRMRKVYGRFRYFGCFEKGERSGRPHFHMLIYGLMPYIIRYKGTVKRTLNECLASIWQQGFVKVEACNERTIAYVCGYIQKKMDKNEYKPSGVSWRQHTHFSKYSYYYAYKDTYFFMSKGIGYGYIMPRIKDIVFRGFYVLNGFKKGVSKWIRDKLKRMNTFVANGLLSLLNGEDAEECEFLPPYVMEFVDKNPDLIEPLDDEVDIYFKYVEWRHRLNLQKIAQFNRIRV